MKDLNVDTIDIIKNTIEMTGDIDAACIAASINRHSFNKWVVQYPSFKDIVINAKEFYKESIINDWDIAAVIYTNKLLKGQVVKKSSVKRFVHPAPQLEDDESYNPGDTDLVEVYREEREEILQPPKWLLERYLPKEEQESVKIDVNFNAMPEDLDEDDPEAKTLE